MAALFRGILLSASQRYERYLSWCRSLGVPAASFEVWAREIAKISEVSAIRGYGNNLVQTT
jgi:hypothetical protein